MSAGFASSADLLVRKTGALCSGLALSDSGSQEAASVSGGYLPPLPDFANHNPFGDFSPIPRSRFRIAQQQEQILRLKIEVFSLDSTSVKVHPDGTGALKNRPQAIGKSRGGWNTKIHLVAANARTAIIFCLSPGEAHDASVGRQLLLELGPLQETPGELLTKLSHT